MRVRMPRHRPSPAMIVALLALFVALGGTAMAAFVVSSNSQIGPNTIAGANPPSGSHSNIMASSIKATDIMPGTLGTGRIADRNLQGVDLALNTLTGAEINESALGQVPSAANADTLGGHGAGDFVQGGGSIRTIAATLGFDSSGSPLDIPGFARVDFFCNADGTEAYGFATGSDDVNVFFDNGSATPNFMSLAANTSNGSSNWNITVPDGVTISLQGGVHTATLFLYSRSFRSSFLRQSFCTVQGHAIIT